jgi:hypothetical protein
VVGALVGALGDAAGEQAPSPRIATIARAGNRRWFLISCSSIRIRAPIRTGLRPAAAAEQPLDYTMAIECVHSIA